MRNRDEIAGLAVKLIRLLKECDDPEFVDEVVRSVMDCEIYPAIDRHFYPSDDDGMEPLIRMFKE